MRADPHRAGLGPQADLLQACHPKGERDLKLNDAHSCGLPSASAESNCGFSVTALCTQEQPLQLSFSNQPLQQFEQSIAQIMQLIQPGERLRGMVFGYLQQIRNQCMRLSVHGFNCLESGVRAVPGHTFCI